MANKPKNSLRKKLIISAIVLLIIVAVGAVSVKFLYRPAKALVRNTITATVERVVLREINKNVLPAVRETIEEALAERANAYDLVNTWGAYGTGDAQFRMPYGTAINHDKGWLYITDCYNQNVQVFDLNGKFLFRWGTPGDGNSQFNYPGGIAINSQGHVYVPEEHNPRVQVFTAEGEYLFQFGTKGSGDGEFGQPLGVAVDSKDNVYVADLKTNLIQKFDAEGKFLLAFGGEGDGDGKFRGPYNLVTDSEDNLYAVDRGNNRIQKFAPDGQFLLKWGRNGGDGKPGMQTGDFNWPHELAIDDLDRIYVSDTYNYRIQVFSTDGSHLFSFGSIKEFGVPKTISIDRNFNMYVADPVGTLGYVTRWKPNLNHNALGALPDHNNEAYPDFPRRLSQFGVYPDFPKLSRVAPNVHAYAPEWELWTNGAIKIRHLMLPSGVQIDASQPEEWQYPQGTAFFKTFAYQDPKTEAFRPVETRVIRRGNTDWEYAAYIWNQDGTDASLLSGQRPEYVEVNAEGQTFEHTIPSRNNCLACHGRKPGFILGFEEVQLNYTPAGKNETLLEYLAAKEIFNRSNFANAARIGGKTEQERQMRGYIHSNCASCHNNVEMWDFTYAPPLTAWYVPPRRNSGQLLTPGSPEDSAIYRLLAEGTMPPVGVQIQDAESIAYMGDWIRSLKERP